jgi:hypothetical protein
MKYNPANLLVDEGKRLFRRILHEETEIAVRREYSRLTDHGIKQVCLALGVGTFGEVLDFFGAVSELGDLSGYRWGVPLTDRDRRKAMMDLEGKADFYGGRLRDNVVEAEPENYALVINKMRDHSHWRKR